MESFTLVEETLFRALSMMINADTNIEPVEIDSVRSIVKEVTGRDVSEKDIRVMAHSEFIEDKTLESYLSSVQSKLSPEDKKMIMSNLVKVMQADNKTRPRETVMFNSAATALKIPPSDLVSL